MPEPFTSLIDVLTRTRQLLLLPENDFAWSPWDDAEAAVRDIDRLIEVLREGKLPPRMDLGILFAPTGAIQEVSVSSGWDDEFIALSAQFDRAEERAYGRSAAGSGGVNPTL
jgi:hypothetical protein